MSANRDASATRQRSGTGHGRTRRYAAAVAGLALLSTGIAGVPAPVAAAPVTGGSQAQPEPVPETSAVIEFTDAAAALKETALSPYLAEIVRSAGRVRTVDIRAGALGTSLTAETVTIGLFDDVTLAVDTTVALSEGAGLGRTSSLTYSAASEDSVAIVTIIDNDVHGTFWQGATRYGIEPLGDGRHLVFEDGRVFPAEAAPLGLAGRASAGAATASPGSLTASTVVDVMVGYDEWAKTVYGGAAATEAEIIDMINQTNLVLSNSLVDVEVALTNTLDLNYTPNSSDHTDEYSNYLFAIRDGSDGIVDNLHTEREANDADLIAVISTISESCGATIYDNVAPEDVAYTLSDATCAVGNLTFPHEIGHTLCAAHDPEHSSFNRCGHQDGFGHYSSVENLRTVMSYADWRNDCEGCVRIPYFSNPDVSHNGWTTGIVDERDNARVVGVTAPVVAAWR